MTEEEHMKTRLFNPIAWNALPGLLAVILLGVLAVSLYAQSTENAAVPSAPAQKAFDTPQQAAEALIQAAAGYDVSALLEIFGPDGKNFISSADPVRDKSNAAAFAAKARERNSVTLDA